MSSIFDPTFSSNIPLIQRFDDIKTPLNSDDSQQRAFGREFYDLIMSSSENGPAEELPSYESVQDGITSHKEAVCNLSLLQQTDLPPKLHYYVRASTEPSSWRLLTGTAISNAITQHNTTPIHKKRYSIVYPPGYEDVYLHKSRWASNAQSLPRYHVELFGSTAYEPEPITILGPVDHDDSLTNEASVIAIAHAPKAVSRIDDEITQMTRFTAFCEREYYCEDWKYKTASAVEDMTTFVRRAQGQTATAGLLVDKLEKFLAFVNQREGYVKDISRFRRDIMDARVRLSRLRL